MPKVVGKVNRPPDFWSDKEFFSDYWWQDEKKLNTAVNKLEEEVKKSGKIKLYNLQENSPKLQAVQALAGAKVTGMYDEKLLTRIEAAQTQYNTKSNNATEIDAETFTALKKRFDKRQAFYKRHPKYKKTVDLYFDKGKMDEMFYESAVGLAMFVPGMKPLGKSVTKAKGVKSTKQKTKLDAVDDVKASNRKGESDVDLKAAAGASEVAEGAGKVPPKKNSLPDWLKDRWEAGNNFNKENRPRYPYNEVELEAKEVGGKKFVVDSYVPNKEIVSRKFTQLSEVKESTAISYVKELAQKYSSGSKISNSPFNPNALKGGRLKGELILEIPVQNKQIPQSVLDEATKNKITIRDINGKEYN